MTISQAFDSVLPTCTLLPDTLAWQGLSSFTVDVDGRCGRRTIRGRCPLRTPAGLRDALANVLRDYCAIAAVEIVTGAEAQPN